MTAARWRRGVDTAPDQLPILFRRKLPIQEAYRRWLQTQDGQRIYHEAYARARMLRRRGIRHFGIAAIFEAIRYDRAVEVGRDDGGFKVNNNYRALVARDLMAEDPALADLFSTRTRRS